MSDDAALNKVLGIILVDAYGEDEEQTAFLTVLDEEIDYPAEATLLGSPVEVTELDIPGGRREVVARCESRHGAGEVAFADLRFPPDTVAAWLHAAYRSYLGIEPFPARPRPDWSWP